LTKKDWNFKEWASESFGVFHGDALRNMKIRFAKEVANERKKFSSIHHKNQSWQKWPISDGVAM
jgi:hypothetical protein